MRAASLSVAGESARAHRSVFPRFFSFFERSRRGSRQVSRELKNGPFIRVHIFKVSRARGVDVAPYSRREKTRERESQRRFFASSSRCVVFQNGTFEEDGELFVGQEAQSEVVNFLALRGPGVVNSRGAYD